MTALRQIGAAFWQQAVAVRDEWLAIGLDCGPTGQAQTEDAEQAISQIYAGLGRARPRFTWVDSPSQARPLVAHLPGLAELYGWVKSPPMLKKPPLASDLATALSRLRGRMDDQITAAWFDPKPPKREKGKPWPDLPATQALAYGVPFADVVRKHVRGFLYAQLAHGFYLPAKRMLGEPGPVCWYGQQEAHWLAYYEVWRRLGLAKYGLTADAQLDNWQLLARSAGWFWPDEKHCVISRKPVAPGTFADGWQVAGRSRELALTPL
jgi:hypothetical protein